MLSKTLIIAVAATGLMAGAAFAQDAAKSYPDKASTPPDKIQDSSLSPNTVNPAPAPTNDITPAPVGAQSNVAATVPDTSAGPATITNELVTNGPVPDTPANRAKYGAPQSRAGKMTRPAGN
jgi:hypothetical protein